MRASPIGLVLLLTAAVPAQSPLTTMFASNNQQNVGGGVYFDLTVNVPILVTALDVNLSAAGQSGSIDFYLRPNSTWVGNVSSSAGWQLLGSAPVQNAGANLPSAAVFAVPFPLNPGTHGVALCHVGVAGAYTNGTGSNQTWSNQELTLVAGGAQNVCLTGSSVFQPRVWNGSIHYLPASNAALATAYGQGCPDEAASFYELFAVNGFDLAGAGGGVHSVLLAPSGTGWVVVPGSNRWFPPASAALPMPNESTWLQPLPFALAWPGGTSNVITIGSNGYVLLGNSALPSDSTPTVAELLSQGPRFCPLWMDLDPGAGGGVFFDVDPASGTAHVTWNQVPEFAAAGTSNSVQLAIDPAGVVEFRWRNCANTRAAALVGWSPGAGNRNPGSRDLSAGLGFVTAPDMVPLQLRASARPVLGTSIDLVTRQLPAGTGLGLLFLSATRLTPALPLAGQGMPGCFQHLTPDVAVAFLTSGSSGSVRITVPPNPAFAGMRVPTQSVTLTPGFNPLGVLSSNGLELKLDLQ